VCTSADTFGLLGPRESAENIISTGTAVFAGLTVMANRQTDRYRQTTLCPHICSKRPLLASAAVRPDNAVVRNA